MFEAGAIGRGSWFSSFIAVALVGRLFGGMLAPDWDEAEARAPIPYSALVELVRGDQVLEVTISGQHLHATLGVPVQIVGRRVLALGEPIPPETDPADIVRTARIEAVVPEGAEADLLALLAAHGVTVTAQEPAGSGNVLGTLNALLSMLFILALVIFIWRGFGRGQGGLSTFGRSRARIYDPARPPVTFADVAGVDEAKEQLAQVVDFLRRPEEYARIGARPPHGVLLVGPPGTGKTLMARAVAGEAGVPFFSISASEFVELFVGVGASRVRDLFRQAKKSAPAIVFVDELDAVGRQRGASLTGTNDEREQTLNQLLVELDGFEERERVVVLAATNRPDVLDAALLRPGRFDRQVRVDLPDRAGREAILATHARRVALGPDVDCAAIAAATPGFAGADLANLINEAALVAVGRRKAAVERVDVDAALDRIVLGAERPLLIGERERRVLAYHEAGHALVAHLTPGTDPLRKISIVPRGQALGVTVQSPAEDRFTLTRGYLRGRLAVLLGGRAAEQLVFDEQTTGAENDLKEATGLARRMVGRWGMGEGIGPLFLGLGESHAFLGGEMGRGAELSDALRQRAEAEVGRLLGEAAERARALLSANRPTLDRLAEALLAEETIGEEALAALLGPAVPPGRRAA